MSKDTGGPAFPRPASLDPEFDARIPSQQGMTLRDYFAAKAMQGYCSRENSIECDFEDIAKDAYDVADAMLKARSE